MKCISQIKMKQKKCSSEIHFSELFFENFAKTSLLFTVNFATNWPYIVIKTDKLKKADTKNKLPGHLIFQNVKTWKKTETPKFRKYEKCVSFVDSENIIGVWVCWCCVLFALLIVLWCVVFLVYVVVATLLWLIIAFFVGCSCELMSSQSFFGLSRSSLFQGFDFVDLTLKTRHPYHQLIISYDQWTYLNFPYLSS